MHNALLIPEIFLCILEYATIRETRNDAYDSDAGNLQIQAKTALMIALTCKSFRDFAIDRMWATLSSMIPLLQTLPESIWTIKRVNYHAGGKIHFFVCCSSA
jgi:hypothetical protein